MRHLTAGLLATFLGLASAGCATPVEETAGDGARPAAVDDGGAAGADGAGSVDGAGGAAGADAATALQGASEAPAAGADALTDDEQAARDAFLDAIGGNHTPAVPPQLEPAIPAISARPPDLAPSIVWFAPFGPTPGCSVEEFVRLSELVGARFMEDPDAAQVADLDLALADAEIGDVTPPAINALLGLDMADPADTARADALMEWWYDAQVEYKKVVLHGDPEDVREVVVEGRLAAIDGWVRWWRRTLDRADGLEIFRTRVADLRAYLEADRERRRKDAPKGEG